MPAVVIRLRVFITHDRFGGERFVAAFPRDRVGELIVRLLVEAGIEQDPKKWELLSGTTALPTERTVGELLAINPPMDGLTLRPSAKSDSGTIFGSTFDIPMRNDATQSGSLAIGFADTESDLHHLSAHEGAGSAQWTPLRNDFTDILLRKGIVSRQQLDDSERIASEQGLKVRDVLIKLNYATASECLAAIAEKAGLAFIDLNDVEIPKSILELLPESVARENIVLPLSLEGNTLKIVTADADHADTVQKLQFILNKDIVVVLATPEQLQDAINRYYGDSETESVDSLLIEFTDTAIVFTQTESMSNFAKRNTDPPPAPMPPAAPVPAPPWGPDATGRYVIEDDEFELTLDSAVPSDSGSREDSTPASTPPEIVETDFEVPSMEPPEREAVTPTDAAAPVPVSAPSPVHSTPPGAMRLPRTPVLSASAARDQLDRMRSAEASTAKTKTLSTTERRATVRYYSRMNPDRVFPLLVMLTRHEVDEVVKKYVEQKATGPLTIAKDMPVEIEPVLPGCQCHPPKVTTLLGASDDVFTFHIVPHVLGEVTGARVLIRQDHKLLAEIAIDMRVVQRTLVVASGLSTFVVPAASAAMKHFGLDFTPKDGRNPYLAALNFLFGEVSPVVLTLALAAVTVGLYWFTRPKGRDVFFDISTKPAK